MPGWGAREVDAARGRSAALETNVELRCSQACLASWVPAAAPCPFREQEPANARVVVRARTTVRRGIG